MGKSHRKLILGFDRLLSKSIWKQLGILAMALFLISVLLWIIGLAWKPVSEDLETFCNDKNLNQLLLPIYLIIDSNALNNLYINDDNLPLSGGLLICSTIAFLFGVIFFNGAIISIITNFIGQRVSNYKEGRTHYLKSGHYIIMGYDDMVPSIISQIFEKDKNAFVLLLSAIESELIREKLKKVFDEELLEHIIVNYGHRTSSNCYRDIHLESAEQIYIVGMRNLPVHDAVNVECLDSICTYLESTAVANRPKRIICVFEDLDTYAAFKTSNIFGRINSLDVEFVPYNFYTGWAKQVFVKRFHRDLNNPAENVAYPAVYGSCVSDDPRYAHLVFVGTTNFSVAFAMEAAHVLHFPNGDKVKTRITFIDRNADREKDEFIVRNRHLFEIQQYLYSDMTEGNTVQKEPQGARSERLIFNRKDANFLDVEFEFIKGDVFSKEVQNLISSWADEHGQKQHLSIFLAMANQRQNFTLGMNMPDAVYSMEVPIFIRQDYSDNFVSNLRKTDEAILSDVKSNTYYKVAGGEIQKKVQGGRYANIYPFGMEETAYCADEKSLEIAKLINYLYSTMNSDGSFKSCSELSCISNEVIWETANTQWKKLSVAHKWSNLYSAYSLRIKLDILRQIRGLSTEDESHDKHNLSDEEVEIMARMEHNRWNVEKLLMGFRKPHRDEDKYAYKDDAVKKELSCNKNRFIHHDIRPFDQLDGIQNLDREFSRYIPWIIEMINIQK